MIARLYATSLLFQRTVLTLRRDEIKTDHFLAERSCRSAVHDTTEKPEFTRERSIVQARVLV